jgi:RNA polymerase-interacting CarD/CdnL/TRCF family regulator
VAVAPEGSVSTRFVSPRAGGFKDRDALVLPPFDNGAVSLSVAKTVTGNMQVDVCGLHHGHVRFIVRLPVVAADEIEMRVMWSPKDVKLFIDGRQLDEWRVPGRRQ